MTILESQSSTSQDFSTRKKRRLVGIVTRDRQDKTRRVEISRPKKHPRYGKIIRSTLVCHVHDEANVSVNGDIVEIVESRPYSKTKRWMLLRVVEAASLKGTVDTRKPHRRRNPEKDGRRKTNQIEFREDCMDGDFPSTKWSASRNETEIATLVSWPKLNLWNASWLSHASLDDLCNRWPDISREFDIGVSRQVVSLEFSRMPEDQEEIFPDLKSTSELGSSQLAGLYDSSKVLVVKNRASYLISHHVTRELSASEVLARLRKFWTTRTGQDFVPVTVSFLSGSFQIHGFLTDGAIVSAIELESNRDIDFPGVLGSLLTAFKVSVSDSSRVRSEFIGAAEKLSRIGP